MFPRNVLDSQPFEPARQARRTAAGCWKLAAGKALSLRPRTYAVLQIAQGQVWLTVRGSLADRPGVPADHVLRAGEQLVIAPGQHVVMEVFSAAGAAEAVDVAFRWDRVAMAPAAQRLGLAACDWECGVVQPLRDLVRALGQGGRAAGAALVDAARAGGRLAAGLARFALHRVAAPLQRRPA